MNMQEIVRKKLEILHPMEMLDVQKEMRRSVDFLKQYMVEHPFLESFVLGISGGVDSTLAGKMAQTAVDELNASYPDKEYKFIAVRLPYGLQRDEDEAQAAIAYIKPSKVVTVDIAPAVDASIKSMERATGTVVSDFIKGNEKARERMKAQFTLGAMYKGVVLGTDHGAEAITGFYTKFGDGAADLLPLHRLNKRTIRMMLAHWGCPEALYKKEPTADLEDNKPLIADEVALGVTYENIDDYLEGLFVEQEQKEKIENWYVKTEHKRNPPITVWDNWWKVNGKAESFSIHYDGETYNFNMFDVVKTEEFGYGIIRKVEGKVIIDFSILHPRETNMKLTDFHPTELEAVDNVAMQPEKIEEYK